MANFNEAYLTNYPRTGYINAFPLEANFNPAFDLSKVNEGGYVFDPNDIGGETYRGIARKYHPEWKGFAILDKMPKPIKYNFTSPELDALAGSFYRNIYWTGVLGELINDQQNANQIYDSALSGLPRTNAMVRHVLNTKFRSKLPLLQTMDLKVIDALNSVNQKDFFNEFKKYRTKLFQYSAGALPKSDSLYKFFQTWNKTSDENRKKQNRWLKGWLYRVNKYNYKGGASSSNSNIKNLGYFVAIVALDRLLLERQSQSLFNSFNSNKVFNL